MVEASEELVTKLHPQRFPGMSGKLAAIVGYVLGQDWTEPQIAEMAVTSDGGVLARTQGDIGMNDFIGAAADLERNWHNLLDVAQLTVEERIEAEDLMAAKITDWRRA